VPPELAFPDLFSIVPELDQRILDVRREVEQAHVCFCLVRDT